MGRPPPIPPEAVQPEFRRLRSVAPRGQTGTGMPDCLGVCFLVLALLPAGEALALLDERLELSASQSAYRDDNVLRQPGGSPPSADTYRVTTLGLALDTPVGDQRLRGALAVNSVRYDSFGEFDLDGHDGQGVWEWRAGDLKGKLGAAHRRALASLGSVQDGVQSRIPNALTTRRAYASGEAMLGPSWALSLEGSRLEQSNAAEERQPNDLALDGGEAVLAYVSRAGNRLGLRGRAARGELPNPQLLGTASDNSYRPRELAAVLDWRPGGHTRLRAHAGRVQRTYEQLPARDFSGGTWELLLDWAPGGKLEFGVVAQRAISDTEEINVSFVLAERVALQAKYRPSALTELSAVLETADRRYLGDAAQLLGAAPARSERLSAAGLQAGYRPLPQVTLSLALRRERRSDAVGIGAYEVDVAGVGARIGF